MNTTLEDITALIIKKLLENPKIPLDIDGNCKIMEDLALDSLAIMNFLMDIEDTLDVSVPLDQLADIHTINDLALCILKLKNQLNNESI